MKFDCGTINDANKRTLTDLCNLQSGVPDDLASTLHTLALIDMQELHYFAAVDKLQTALKFCAVSTSPAISIHLAAEIGVSLGRANADLGRSNEAEGILQTALRTMESRWPHDHMGALSFSVANLC